MKYALLIYTPTPADEYSAITTTLRSQAPGQRDAAAPGPWVEYTRAAKQAGVLLGAEQLTHAETATSVRFQGTDRLVTDGPFMETKENLLGFYLIEVADLDEAMDWARRMPSHDGQTVEVRAALTGLPWMREL
jgi:hypothetical protein